MAVDITWLVESLGAFSWALVPAGSSERQPGYLQLKGRGFPILNSWPRQR